MATRSASRSIVHPKKRRRNTDTVSVSVIPAPPLDPLPHLESERKKILAIKDDLNKLLDLPDPRSVISILFADKEYIPAYLMAINNQKLYDHCYVLTLTKDDQRGKMSSSLYKFTNQDFLIGCLKKNPEILQYMLETFSSEEMTPVIRQLFSQISLSEYCHDKSLLNNLLVTVLKFENSVKIPLVKTLVDAGADISLIFATGGLLEG